MYYQQSAMNIANTPRIDHVLLPVTFDLIYSKKQAELGHQLCILSSLQSGAYEHLWMYAWHTKSTALDLWPPEQDSCSAGPPNVVHTDTITCSWINLILFVLQLCSLIPRPFNSLGMRRQFVLIAIHKVTLSMQTTPESEAADVLTTSECHNNNWRRHILPPSYRTH